MPASASLLLRNRTKDLFRLHFDEDVLEFIELRDSTSFEFHGKKDIRLRKDSYHKLAC